MFIERLKAWYYRYRKEIYFCLILFLVSTLSFALGYLANRELNYTPIIIEKHSD